MSEMLGADPEQLRALAKDMQRSATSFRRLAVTLSAAVTQARWHGSDADNFKRAWLGHNQTLRSVATCLNETSSILLGNAKQQENASSVASLLAPTKGGPYPTQGGPYPTEDTAQTLTDKLNDMSKEERLEYLRSDEFKKWAAENPEAAKQAMDAAADSGLIPKRSKEYSTFLNDYWNNMAMERMGINPSKWDTSKGTEANWDIIKSVYDFYGQQYMNNNDLQWAGMANMIGPSFAGGFQDMAMLRDIARAIADSPLEHISGSDVAMLRAVAAMTDEEIKYYETKMLDMNKEIFLDQARQHMAYEKGGMEEIERLRASGAIDSVTSNAWRDISSADPERIKLGNTVLLDREQNEIISNDYAEMHKRSVTGEAVTWMITLAGEPSIPGAKSYPEVFPLKFSVETGGPENIPLTNWDNPLQFTTHVTTGFPDGNIAYDEDRWKLITKDTLPAYQELLKNNPEEARKIIASDFNDRVQQYRPTNNIPEITERILDGFKVKIEQ